MGPLAFQELPLLAIAIKTGVRIRELETQTRFCRPVTAPALWISEQRLIIRLGHLLQELMYRNFLVVHWVTDPALSLLWLRYSPWPRNMPRAQPERKITSGITCGLFWFWFLLGFLPGL